MKRLLVCLGFAFGLSSGLVSALDEGPADESAYWILKIHGELQPIPVISATELDFGKVEVGKVVTKKVKILNKGYGSLVIKKVYLQNGTQFAIQNTTCTKPLELGQSCEITVAFKPTEAGPLKDTLYIVTNDKANPVYMVALKGVGTAAIIVEEQPQCPTVTTVCPSQLPKKEIKPKPKKVEKKPKPVAKKVKPKKENLLKPKVGVWVVKPCDTLWDISADVYGTPLLWAAIFEANKGKISDPWILKIGTKLKIPALTPEQVKKYREETLQLMEEMADRPLGPKCPF